MTEWLLAVRALPRLQVVAPLRAAREIGAGLAGLQIGHLLKGRIRTKTCQCGGTAVGTESAALSLRQSRRRVKAESQKASAFCKAN